jgi:hypothetical protein
VEGARVREEWLLLHREADGDITPARNKIKVVPRGRRIAPTDAENN